MAQNYRNEGSSMAKIQRTGDSTANSSDVRTVPMAANKTQKGPPSRQVGGSYDDQFNIQMLNDVIRTFWAPPAEDSNREDWMERNRKEAIVSLAGIRPTNELEGMVAAQMVAAHAATMECYRRAAVPEQHSEARQANLRMAAKASRSFATLLESLQKLRGESGKQTVSVHHHHHKTDARTQVAAENAVVSIGAPGGALNESSNQPHEQEAISHEPGKTIDVSAALRREESSREPVPLAGNEREKAMPATRRKKPRCAEG